MGLSDTLTDQSVKQQVINDCCQLMDQQVAAKKGLGGMALKAAYKVVKGIRASYIPEAVNTLLPTICNALDPLWEEGGKTDDPVNYLVEHQSQAAEQILGVTDARIAKSSNKVVKGAYGKLRQSVKTDVEAAIPGLAQIIGNYASPG